MKRIAIAIFISILLVCSSCQTVHSNQPNTTMIICENITMKLLTGTESSTGASFSIMNGENLEINFGYDYFVQTYIDEQWIDLLNRETVSFPALIKETVQPQQTIRWDIDWSKLYGELGPGQYRIIRQFSGRKKLSAYSEETQKINGEVHCEFVIP